ncbi:MAG: hypothetical protein FWF97_00570 [Alphaproteobacteria bacterium]|nr:hypothetical protein [Alphaproteobacteria bacterium]
MPNISIEFDNPGAKAAFDKLYGGTLASYSENYKGTVRHDRSMGMSFANYTVLEREKIVDFRKFGQDVQIFGGKIR